MARRSYHLPAELSAVRESARFRDSADAALEAQARPLWDKVYRKVFGRYSIIQRYPGSTLDRRLHIDAVVSLLREGTVTIAEKCLRHKFAERDTLTVEFSSWDGSPGDWTQSVCQFYALAYMAASGKSFSKWVVASWPQLLLATGRDEVLWRSQANTSDGCAGVFKYTALNSLPKSVILAASWL